MKSVALVIGLFLVASCVSFLSLPVVSAMQPEVATIAFDPDYPAPGLLDSDTIVYKGTYHVTMSQAFQRVDIYYYNADNSDDFGIFTAHSWGQFGGTGYFEYTASASDSATYHCWAVLWVRKLDGTLVKIAGTPTVDVVIQ